MNNPIDFFIQLLNLYKNNINSINLYDLLFIYYSNFFLVDAPNQEITKLLKEICEEIFDINQFEESSQNSNISSTDINQLSGPPFNLTYDNSFINNNQKENNNFPPQQHSEFPIKEKYQSPSYPPDKDPKTNVFLPDSNLIRYFISQRVRGN